MVIVREAGCSVTRENGDAFRLGDQIVVASNGALHEQLISALDLGGILE
jgi:fructose-1,6-bisphosphatase/inositol monophosphatase family enzyme